MATSQTNQGVPEHVKEMFINWKSSQQTGYGATAEESFRLQVFYENYKKVNALNALGGATFALNKFADLTKDEIRTQYMGAYKSEEGPRKNAKSLKGLQVPESVDWTTKGAINTPMNQDKCGACYAFSSTGALEALNFIKTGKLNQFSQQQIIDCSREKPFENEGCNGGRMDYTFKYTADKGIASLAQYPYRNEEWNNLCKEDIVPKGKRVNTGFEWVPKFDNDEMKAAVSQQPIAVAVNAFNWIFYSGGIFDDICDEVMLNHAVLIVGYGVDQKTGKSYYKIKNSYGADWGRDGFIMLEQKPDGEPGRCGVLSEGVYPTM